MNRLHYILQGIKRIESEAAMVGRPCLPMSPRLLRNTKPVWEADDRPPDATMLWAACCLTFFGFLRVGELVAPGLQSFDRGVHLYMEDIAVDDTNVSNVVKVSIKQSKMDPFHKGVKLFLGRMGTGICPIVALGPLFQFRDGTYLTQQSFLKAVR